jgi:hypothetical protein
VTKFSFIIVGNHARLDSHVSVPCSIFLKNSASHAIKVPSGIRNNETNLEAKNIPLLATHLIVILSCQYIKFS